MGGELTYRYLDANGLAQAPFRYEVTARVYFNGESDSTFPTGAPTINLAVLSKGPGGGFLLRTSVPMTELLEITPPELPGCVLRVPRVVLGLYVTTVSLPGVADGYLATFTASARNRGIVNLLNSQSEGMTLSVDIVPPPLRNSSPVFSDNALVVVCAGDTSFVLNNAYDVDGDRLSYSLATPFNSFVGQAVAYAPGYSGALPFGPQGFAAVDARTGLARYLCFAQGTYLLAIDVREYRTVNGREILLGTLRRDIQIVVRTCNSAPNQAPAFSAATGAQKDFVVEEGQTLDFAMVATDPENQRLTMTVGSVLLDGPGATDAAVNGQPGTRTGGSAVGTVDLTGTGTVTGNFRLRAGCALARAAPYDVLVTVADAVCGSKSIATVFRITVIRRAPPTGVRGDSVLCAQRVATYTASGPAFAEYRWTARGGRVLAPATGRAVQVEWLAGGANTVAVRGVTPTGCLTDSAALAVAVEPGPPIKGLAAYCRTANTGLRYTIAGPPAPYQWRITNGTIVSGQGTNAVEVDIPAGGGTAVLQAANPAQTACVTTLRIALDETCLYFYNVITPNGDGQNDVFTIENVERHPNTALTVYNRWGRAVYQSRDYRNTYGGEGTAPGLHYYLCQLTDGTTYKGWFEVVR